MHSSMNAPSRSLAANRLLGLRLREVQTSCLGWGLYMAALTVYCMVYEVFVGPGSPDLQGSVMWAIREWGIWLLLTPIAFKTLRRRETVAGRRIPVFLQMGAGVLMVSLTFRVGLDVITGTREALASLVIFFPRHLAALAVVVLVWHLFLRPRPAADDEPAPETDAHEQEPAAPEYPETLLVSKGQDECLIRVDRIQCITAAGNYVEIYCDNRLYLMRATMKQIEDLLPPSVFLRTHRSHIINVDEIERIKTHPSGNGEVRLRCGKVLNVSKKYKHRLQQYRLQAA